MNRHFRRSGLACRCFVGLTARSGCSGMDVAVIQSVLGSRNAHPLRGAAGCQMSRPPLSGPSRCIGRLFSGHSQGIVILACSAKGTSQKRIVMKHADGLSTNARAGKRQKMAITGSILAGFALLQAMYESVLLGSVFDFALVCLSQTESSLFRWAVCS